ncbi:MAG: ATP-grasp domain-containing protein [Lachnospiraceae bacterium]|nr:ATP-grasp domain-containing protein [Lachnospiraceae bacterium]
MENKKGLIIYAPEDVEKNRGFVDSCTSHLKKWGIALELVVLEDKEQPELKKIDGDISFAINRSRNKSVARQLEGMGIRVFNSSYVTEIGNDKWKTYEWAVRNSVPVLPTKRIPTVYREQDYPVVIKSRAGHGGSEVFKVTNEEEYNECVDKIEKKGIIQPLADTGGRDVRVYVLGGEIVVSICRQAKDGFKSNFSLGGEVYRYELLDAEKDLVNKVVSLLKLDYAGIDFIYDGDNLVLNEIEDAVGARMVYETTDIDIIGRFMEYIRLELEGVL